MIFITHLLVTQQCPTLLQNREQSTYHSNYRMCVEQNPCLWNETCGNVNSPITTITSTSFICNQSCNSPTCSDGLYPSNNIPECTIGQQCNVCGKRFGGCTSPHASNTQLSHRYLFDDLSCTVYNISHMNLDYDVNLGHTTEYIHTGIHQSYTKMRIDIPRALQVVGIFVNTKVTLFTMPVLNTCDLFTSVVVTMHEINSIVFDMRVIFCKLLLAFRLICAYDIESYNVYNYINTLPGSFGNFQTRYEHIKDTMLQVYPILYRAGCYETSLTATNCYTDIGHYFTSAYTPSVLDVASLESIRQVFDNIKVSCSSL